MISSVQVLDDDPQMRATFADTVVDANLEPVREDRTWLGELEDYLAQVPSADAALTDFDLRSKGYAPFNGAQLVEGWYRKGFPAVLCTRFEKAHIDLIRPHRAFIPVLMTLDQLNPDTLGPAFELCVKELDGNPSLERKARRTQIHFVSTGEAHGDAFLAEVPAWGSEVIRLPHSMIPTLFVDLITPDYRCHALVNLGAERSEDLFFDQWEPA